MKTDRWWLKCYAFVAWVLDTVQSTLFLSAAYTYLVTDIGNVTALGKFEK